MSLYPNVMPSPQQRVLRQLGSLTTERGFYLGGGTALAIQLGHRRSIDLDWFTDLEIPDPLRLAEALRGEGLALQVESIEPGTLHGKAGGVLLSFLEYRYPLLETSVDWEEYGCRLASLDDLACMKLSAIGSRGAKKDFIDIYALGQAGHTLGGMLSLYQRKFQTPDIAHVLFGLTYFDDAEADEMPEMIWDVSWEEVKRAIEGTVLAFEQRDRTRPVEGMEG